MGKEKCDKCGKLAYLKTGWSNERFCSESCERLQISRLHGSMPGCNKPWLPGHISLEITRRWAEE